MNKVLYRRNLEIDDLKRLNEIFGHTFDTEIVIDKDCIEEIINDDKVCVIGSYVNDSLVGGLVAYELHLLNGKKEMYIYDIAVLSDYRRMSIGTGLINELKEEAKKRGVITIFVEAEADDGGAVAFYRSLKVEEISVCHFNIDIK